MTDINCVMISGRLTRDPEISNTQSGTALCKVGFAVNDGWGDNQRVHFLDITFWAKQAETVHSRLQKGDSVWIRGALDYQSWQTQDGSKRSKVGIKGWEWGYTGSAKKHERQDQAPRETRRQTQEPEAYSDEANNDIPF